MDNNQLPNELVNLNNLKTEELIELYNKVSDFIGYLDSSLIVEEGESNE